MLHSQEETTLNNLSTQSVEVENVQVMEELSDADLDAVAGGSVLDAVNKLAEAVEDIASESFQLVIEVVKDIRHGLL